MRRLVAVSVLSLAAACTGPHTAVTTLSPDLGNTRPPPTATGVGAASAPTPVSGTLVIQVGDYFFLPAHITVTVGTTVIWHPVGELFHTIVPKEPANAWRNGVTAGMGSRDFEWTFNRPATIFYHCDYHPGAMDAILVVVDEG